MYGAAAQTYASRCRSHRDHEWGLVLKERDPTTSMEDVTLQIWYILTDMSEVETSDSCYTVSKTHSFFFMLKLEHCY